ncbi:MAG TPA: hypothetical protein VGN12_18440 [Pirellulales bacterium]|jgi:hypothetical protein
MAVAVRNLICIIAMAAVGIASGCASPAANNGAVANSAAAPATTKETPTDAAQTDAVRKSYSMPGMCAIVVGGPSTDSG